MYLEQYGLKESPFSITPDPRYVFLSERHRDALAHLLYGIGKGGSGGFVQLTGEVGTGKTTLCRLLLEQLPENTRVALVLNPKVSPVELVETVCEELKLDIEGKRGSLKALVDTLNTFLLDAYAQGLRVVLIVDEAQNLSVESLEQVRLLTNLETPTQKLLQIILLGQPELRTLLERQDLRQLAQRITARYHLMPLDADECEAYVRHRMAVAGSRKLPFTRLGLRALYQRSGGVPRLINIIADRSLMAGFARETDAIGERLVDLAADETLPGHARYYVRRYGRWAALGIAVASASAAAWWANRPVPAPAPPVLAPVAPAATQADPSEELVAKLGGGAATDLAAWTQLLSRWQVSSSEVSVAEAARCQPQIFPGFDCLRGRATLEQLARFDRPLLLELEAGGKHGLALLRGISGDKVQLDFAGTSHTLDRSAVTRLWQGGFYATWRLPADVPGRLKQGDAGAGVAWVKGQLARLDGHGEGNFGPAYFDAALEERVRKLQVAYGLTADGIVGPETLFALAALSPEGPHLARNVE
ncbi:ExeA family protein [Tahibacter amnicola]|uniref:AAA family ATPase n=1 Tax=Tahibacter amnicola TaxID=2976241 RepID=A0ABY6BF20_9GAMM|nr:ExeA family protein [Tahibacter amnicola]UXI68631.1 AAA family ATPase [Tahibacter amnicola]